MTGAYITVWIEVEDKQKIKKIIHRYADESVTKFQERVARAIENIAEAARVKPESNT
jgi:hypothetical protein